MNDVTEQDIADAEQLALTVSPWGVGASDDVVIQALTPRIGAISLSRPDLPEVNVPTER